MVRGSLEIGKWRLPRPGSPAMVASREKVFFPPEGACSRSASHLLQILVHELDCYRTLADGRRDALDRAGAHIPGREHARPAGFEQKRWPLRAQVGDWARAGPVRTNPFESISISLGNQSVRGTAPMKLKSAAASSTCVWPVLLLTISIVVRRRSPDIRLTSVLSSTSMLPVSSSRRAR